MLDSLFSVDLAVSGSLDAFAAVFGWGYLKT